MFPNDDHRNTLTGEKSLRYRMDHHYEAYVKQKSSTVCIAVATADHLK